MARQNDGDAALQEDEAEDEEEEAMNVEDYNKVISSVRKVSVIFHFLSKNLIVTHSCAKSCGLFDLVPSVASHG